MIESQGQPLSSPAPLSAHCRVVRWNLPPAESPAGWGCHAQWVTSAAVSNLNFNTASAIKSYGEEGRVTAWLYRSQQISFLLTGLNPPAKTQPSCTAMAAEHMRWWEQIPLSGFYSRNHRAAPFIPFVFCWLRSYCFFADCLCLISLRVLVP